MLFNFKKFDFLKNKKYIFSLFRFVVTILYLLESAAIINKRNMSLLKRDF